MKNQNAQDKEKEKKHDTLLYGKFNVFYQKFHYLFSRSVALLTLYVLGGGNSVQSPIETALIAAD